MPYSPERLSKLSTDDLAHLLVTVLREVAGRPDTDAFETLLLASQEVGVCLGSSARLLAEHGSWSQVAELSGTSKQAAWQRWSQS
jgi:hypothetical protein